MTNRAELLKEINETSFMLDDLRLFLDTHPTNQQALESFSTAMKKRKQLLNRYAEEFEPLTVDCVCPETNNRSGFMTKYPNQKHFTWADGPLPWEGGTV